jgi:DNA-binding response OmpR family regulator
MTPTPRHLLLVDDDAHLLTACVHALRLERPGWTVATAADGAGALAALKARPADLVVTDLVMPGMDGLALLAALRRDPATAALPAIVITALDDRTSQRQAMGAGADDYLAKPFTVQELIEAVEARLARRSQLAGQAGTAPAVQARLAPAAG